MRVVLQRVKHACVTVAGAQVGKIDTGIFCLLGICESDVANPLTHISWLVKKVTTARLFPNAEGKQWGGSIKALNLPILLVSQFTLHGNLRKPKPDFHHSAKTEDARRIWELAVSAFKEELGEENVQTGAFGEDMDVALVNWGPVTLTLDSANRNEVYAEESSALAVGGGAPASLAE